MRSKPKLYMLPLQDGGKVFVDIAKRLYVVQRFDGAATSDGKLSTMPDEYANMPGWHRNVRRAMDKAGV